MSTKPEQQELQKVSWFLLITVALLTIVGAYIGLEMMVTFGLSPYTAIIGIICAMVLARIPLSLFQQFRSKQAQNLLQMSVNCATFGAANALLVPIGIPFLLGRTDLILPMLIGASLAMFVDALFVYRFFGTQLFPAEESWPKGLATAKTIEMGVEGGKPLLFFGVGFASGWLGALFHLPFAAIGMAFLSNVIPMAMLAVGNMIGGMTESWWHVDLHALYVPHGVMIGAGFVVLIHSIQLLFTNHKRERESQENKLNATLIKYTLLFFALSFVIAWATGLFRSMSVQQLVLFILLTVMMQFVQRFIVGNTVMQTGFIPAFSLALVFFVMGIMLSLPMEVLAIFAGFTAATGPVLATMGDALKVGYVLRGEGKSPAVERKGKKQQLLVVWLTLLIVVGVVFISYSYYFAQNRVPPIDHVFVATLQASASIEMMSPWLIGAVVLGMILQWIKGTGILFATGLLLNDPFLGGMILFGVLLKLLIKQRVEHSTIAILAAGLISGDVLGRFTSLFR